MRAAMGAIASWILLPSLGLTLVAGLLSMGFNPGYQNAGWALAKLATGILIFEGGFVGVVGPMQDEAERSAGALAGQADAATLAQSLGPEQNTLWVLLAVAVQRRARDMAAAVYEAEGLRGIRITDGVIAG